MKFLAILMLHAIIAQAFAAENPAVENTYVKVSVSLANTTAAQGGTGKIMIAFTPIDGIHINADPPFVVKIERNGPVKLEGRPNFTTDKESGNLSIFKPVAQRFAVTRKAKPGGHDIKGTLVYYFCSDTEGWCRKFTQPIALKLNVVKK